MSTTDKIIEVKVSGSCLTRDSQTAGVQGEANAAALRIEFDPGWDGLAKTVIWWNARGEDEVKRLLTADLLEDITESGRIYLAPIPGEALTVAGKCRFAIDGYAAGKRLRSVYSELVVKPAGGAQESAVEEPTPSQAEQLQTQIDTLLEELCRQAGIAADQAEASAGSAGEAAAFAAAAAQSADGAAGSARNAGSSASAASDSVAAASVSASAAAESAASARLYADQVEASITGVASFNGRGGHVMPASGDYTAAQVGAVPYSLASDCGDDIDAIFTSGNHCAFYHCTSSTKNTPYDKGITTFNICKVFSCANAAATYGFQMAFYQGFVRPYMRYLNNGVIGEWSTGFLPLAGGTLSGNLEVSKSSQPLLKLSSTTNDSDTILIDMMNGGFLQVRADPADTGNYRQLRLFNTDGQAAAANMLRLYACVEGNGKSYDVYGAHNKPLGTYTGNADAAVRTIETGGIGSAAVIWSYAGKALLTPMGGLLFNGSQIINVASSAARIANGVITIASADTCLNGNYTYTYQVL